MRPQGISLMLSVGSTLESDLDIINPMCNSSVQVPHTHPAFCLLVVSLYYWIWWGDLGWVQTQQWGWAEVLISEHRISDFLTNTSAFKLFLHQPRTSYSHSCLSLTRHLCLCLCQTNRVDRLNLREQALAILTNISTLLVAVPTDIPTPWQQCNEPDLHTLVYREHTEWLDNLIVDNSLPLELNTVTATRLPFPPDCLFTFSEDHPLGWLRVMVSWLVYRP